MARFSSFSWVGRALVGALALGVALHGPAQVAQAAGTVDLKVVLQFKDRHVTPGAPVFLTAFAAHDGPATSAGRVEIVIDRGFSNVTVQNAQGFTCTKTAGSFFNSPVWRIVCTKPAIAPNGAWFDAIQISATAPTAPRTAGVIASITPVNATEADSADNQSVEQLTVAW